MRGMSGNKNLCLSIGYGSEVQLPFMLSVTDQGLPIIYCDSLNLSETNSLSSTPKNSNKKI